MAAAEEQVVEPYVLPPGTNQSNFPVPEGVELPEGGTIVAVQTGDQLVYVPSAEEAALKVQPVLKCFLFPPVGGQRCNLGRDLYEFVEVYKEAVLACNAVSKPLLPMELVKVLYPSARDEDMCTEAINSAQYAQPCLFAVQYGLYKYLESRQIRPDVVLGHSVGELMCAVAAGVMDMPTAFKIVCERATLMHHTPSNGSMLALRTGPEQTRKAIDAVVQEDPTAAAKVAVASYNSKESCVLSGDWATVSAVVDQLGDEVQSTRVKASHADHSPLMSVISDRLAQKAAALLEEMPVQQLTGTRVVSSVRGIELKVYCEGEDSTTCGENSVAAMASANYWVEHNEGAVKFDKAVEAVLEIHRQVADQPTGKQQADPILHIVELGDGMLCNMATTVIRENEASATDQNIFVAPCLKRESRDGEQLIGGDKYLDELSLELLDDEYSFKLNRFMVDPVNAPLPPGFERVLDPDQPQWTEGKIEVRARRWGPLMGGQADKLSIEVEKVLRADPGYRTRIVAN